MKRIISIFLTTFLLFATSLSVSADVNPEAAIGSINYDTLQEAINNAQVGDTITVLRDIAVDYNTLITIAPAAAINLTIDLNQKKISYPEDGEWGNAALTISKPITLCIKNGKIDTCEDHEAIDIACVEEKAVDLTLFSVTIQSGHAALYSDVSDVKGKNKITLENVDITSDEYGVQVSYADITFKSGSIHTIGDETFSLSNCSLTIENGEFITTEDSCMDLYLDNILVINGGYFESLDDDVLYLGDDSTATINKGTFKAITSAINFGDAGAIINGGYFESKEGNALEVGYNDILLNGGIFIGGDGNNALFKLSYVDGEIIIGERRIAVDEDGIKLEDIYDSFYVEIIKLPEPDKKPTKAGEKDLNEDGIISCEEEIGSKSWIWSDNKKACVYKVSNTSVK